MKNIKFSVIFGPKTEVKKLKRKLSLPFNQTTISLSAIPSTPVLCPAQARGSCQHLLTGWLPLRFAVSAWDLGTRIFITFHVTDPPSPSSHHLGLFLHLKICLPQYAFCFASEKASNIFQWPQKYLL